MKLINNFLILIIKFYKYFISPYFPSTCRYLPTCSEYSITAFQKHGFLNGFYYSLKRILKCHPFGGHGYDPVPKKINREI